MRVCLRLLAWWLALFWLWLLLAGEWNRQEWVAAAAAAAAGAGVAEVARARTGFVARLPRRAVLDVPRILLRILVDFGLLAWALVLGVARREVVRGGFVTRRRETGDDGRAGAGLRAWLEVAATYSPNAYVVEIEPPNGTVLVHDLLRRRGSESPV